MLYSLGYATDVGERKLLNSAKKIDPVSHPVRMEGLVNVYNGSFQTF